MDDMKRLIEKYKQELMEYSRAAAPKENLAFPEMIGEDEAGQTMSGAEEAPAVTESAPVRETAPAAPAPPAPPAPPINEERLSCQGEPIPDEAAPRQPVSGSAPSAEPVGDDSAQDYEELTPVTFNGNIGAPRAPSAGEICDTAGMPQAPTEAAAEPPKPAGSSPKASGKPARKPEIIGYVDEDGTFDYDSIFGDMLGEQRVSDRRVTPADAPRYDELPSQRENSEENTAESVKRGGDLDYSGEASGVTDNSPREPRPEPTPAGSVTPQQAEQLTERPINSRPTEQLTGRSFENSETPANSRSDIRPLHDGTAPADLPHGSPAYSNLQDFVPSEEFDSDDVRGNNFRFRVYTARNALPIAGANCIIKRKNNGGYVTMYTLVTDISGQTDPVALPAPPASLSQSPGNTVQPYALYDAEVSAKGYNTVEIKNIPVFEGVLSVQQVAMIPQTEENITEIIDEQETDMNGGK
ncbi:MAG: hypothetical protein K2O14_07520 [Oscillospiraceae bacterium]|nr:hypothetical protein [Oscillospiraceae bacterium]